MSEKVLSPGVGESNAQKFNDNVIRGMEKHVGDDLAMAIEMCIEQQKQIVWLTETVAELTARLSKLESLR